MSAWKDVDNTELGEDDFQDVLSAVGELAGTWRPFAAVLGLSPAALKEIDEACRGIPAQCLSTAIDRWLRQEYNYERHGPPSWSKLVMAVVSNVGGQNAALAKKIAQSHRIEPDQYEVMTPEAQATVAQAQAELTSWEQPVEVSEGRHDEQPMEVATTQKSPSPSRNETANCGNSQLSVCQQRVISMKDLQNDLAQIAHKWYNIGLLLGVSAHDLDKISRDGSDFQRLLSDMLSHWLSNNATATRSDLEEMLKSKIISEPKLARKLLSIKEIPEDGPLKETHLKVLVEFLNPLANRWEDIGIQLGLHPRDLDTLKRRGSTTVDAALVQMLKRLDSLEPPKTVDDLIEALSTSSVAEKVYAEQLKIKYVDGYLLHCPADDHPEDNPEHTYEQMC